MIPSTIYATIDTPLGNGAFTADGRLVVSHHPMYKTPHRVSVFNSDGSLSCYPNLAWNTPGDDPMAYFDAVLGLQNDSHGRIWFGDMGTRSNIQPKLVVWDTRADTLWRVIPLPPEVTTPFSEPNDFVIDEARGKVYIADEGAGGGGDGSRAALIVVDIASGSAERRLEGYDGIKAERRPLVIAGQRVERNEADGSRVPLHVGVDGIAMDHAGVWLYLSPLNGHTLWRLPVADLLNPALDDMALATRLEPFAAKPNSGGMAFDEAGNLYLTVIETNTIGRVAPNGRYDEPVVRGDMFWPDDIMCGPDGAMYVVCTQLPRSPALAQPGITPKLPFAVFRFDPHGTTDSEIVKQAAAGALAGLLASAAVSLFQAAWARTKLPPKPDGLLPPPEQLAKILSRDTIGRELTPAETQLGGMLVHFAIGAGLGAVYGALSASSPGIRAGRGTLYGLGVWASLGETGLAVAGLKPPPWRIGAAHHSLEAASHLIFGATLDTALRFL